MNVQHGNKPRTVPQYKSYAVQTLCCGVAALPLLCSGMTLGFTAVALPYMLQPNDLFHIDADQASWIASLATITTPLGCLMSGPIIDRFGRRNGLLYLSFPSVLGWLLISTRPTIAQMYIGRILTGISLGLTSIPSSVYIAEGASPDIRGFLAVSGSIAISLGVEITYLLGLILKENWQVTAVICAIMPLVFGCVIWFLPESPMWLMSKGRYDEACTNLMKLRHTTVQTTIQKELDGMSERLRNNRNKAMSLKTSIKALAKPRAYKPFIIMNLFFLFQQLSGTNVVIFYAVDIIKEAGVTADPFFIAVLIGLARFITTLVSAWTSNTFGRRKCAIISGIGMTVSFLLLAVYLQTKSTLFYDHTFEHPLNETLTNVEPGSSSASQIYSYLPIFCLITYIIMSTFGFLTLPWAMIGELYPSEVRGVAGGLTTCTLYTVTFIILKVYPSMLELLNKHGIFYFYGIMALLGTLFVGFFLPETQGKTLAEIEKCFLPKQKRIPEQEEEEALHSTNMVTVMPSRK